MNKILFLALFVSFNISAQTLCERVEGGIVSYLQETHSRLSFRNHGGLANGGVCWWHARLQRSSAYLADFKPEMAPPSVEEAKIILKQLKRMNQITVIPGFADFYSFTKVFENEVQRMLEAWQREDGFLHQQWTRGISGKYELPAPEMKVRMDTLHEQFLKSLQPIWVMAQIKGVASHAFLILDILPIGNGYELKVIDSNFPLENKVFMYRVGDRFLKHPKDKFSFVPYLGFQKDFNRIQASLEKKCKI